MAALHSDSATSTPQPRNPTSLRIYKILGTNFNDPGTQDALRTVSELYASQALPTRTTDKGHDAPQDSPLQPSHESASVSSRIASNSQDLTDGIEDIAATARQNLRKDTEKRLTETSRKYLAALGEINAKLEVLQTHVKMMHSSYAEADQHLQASTDASKSLLEHATSLRNQRQQVEDRKSIVSLFINRFTLHDAEAHALTSRDAPVGEAFFRAMDRAEQIRDDCQVLMSGEDGPSQAGLDIMAKMSSQIEQGYEKMLRWTAHAFRQMGRDSQLDVHPNLRAAVARLRKTPELLQEVLGQLVEIRQDTVLSSFTTALTRGGPSGLPRPIELHAHDPLRYVGDMLAWVHQAIAAEREFLESLFDVKGDRRMVGSARSFSKGKASEEEGWIFDMMDAAVMKLCVPLKARVEQTIRSQQSGIVSYKVANLLQFYWITMSRTVGEDALLSKTIRGITDLAFTVFYDEVETHAKTLKESMMDPDDTTVAPPYALVDHAQVLKEILNVYQSFLSEDQEEDQSDDLGRILHIMVDSAVEMCTAGTTDKMAIRPVWDGHVFILNSLTYLQNVLEAYPFTEQKQESLAETIKTHTGALLEDHYQNLLEDTGLKHIASVFSSHDGSEPLSHRPGARAYEVQACLHQFASWLSMVEIGHSPRLTRLTKPKLHSEIHGAALERLVEVYRQLCDEVKRASNKYEAAATLLGSERPFGQVALLEQILGVVSRAESSTEDGGSSLS